MKRKADGGKGKITQFDLRQRAEEQIRVCGSDISRMPFEDVQALVHELGVHKVELEIQNEDLRLTQTELAEARDLYLDLYDDAPMGYMTLNLNGIVQKANLTAASMLGVDPDKLVGTRLEKYLTTESGDRTYLAVQNVLASKTEHVCEAEFQKQGGPRFSGVIVFSPTFDRNGIVTEVRVVLSDVTRRKQAEDNLSLRSAELEEATLDLKVSHKRIDSQEDRLSQKDVALREVLGLLEAERSKIRDEVASYIERSVLPVLRRLEENRGDPSLMATLRRSLHDLLSSRLGRSPADVTAHLTAAEEEVCHLIRDGMPTEQICRALKCSPQTVTKYRKNIRRKLGLVGAEIDLASYLKKST